MPTLKCFHIIKKVTGQDINKIAISGIPISVLENVEKFKQFIFNILQIVASLGPLKQEP